MNGVANRTLASSIDDDDFSIIGRYGAELRGYVNYYPLAHNVGKLYRLKWTMETSMLKTLANKHRSSVMKMARKYRARRQLRQWAAHLLPGSRRARRGEETPGSKVRGLRDPPPEETQSSLTSDRRWRTRRARSYSSDSKPTRANCVAAPASVEVHHLRKMADLNRHGRMRCRLVSA